MSYNKYVDLTCDGCGTLEEGDGLHQTAGSVRDHAERHGWKTALPGGRDLYPSCSGADA